MCTESMKTREETSPSPRKKDLALMMWIVRITQADKKFLSRSQRGGGKRTDRDIDTISSTPDKICNKKDGHSPRPAPPAVLHLPAVYTPQKHPAVYTPAVHTPVHTLRPSTHLHTERREEAIHRDREKEISEREKSVQKRRVSGVRARVCCFFTR